MQKYALVITVCLYFVSQSSFIASGQQNLLDSVSWDNNIISEAEKWQYLLVNYYSGDRSSSWTERKQALLNLTEKFPNSMWADDAALMLASGQAVIEDDFDGAIVQLRNIISSYPTSETILDRWDSEAGCLIREGWLYWAPICVSFDPDRNIIRTFPFNRDGHICILEHEALTYFEHFAKYPQLTKDVAQYAIASILLDISDISGAIDELENLLIEYPDLSVIRTQDYQAEIKPYGYFIGHEPPYDQMPIWRVQYAACVLLINLYQQVGENEKAISLSLKLASECSPDGWYWKINRFIGDICSENSEWNLAAEQYDLSLKGIRRFVESKSVEMKILHEDGYLVKPIDFVSWKNEAMKPFASTIDQIEDLVDQSRSH